MGVMSIIDMIIGIGVFGPFLLFLFGRGVYAAVLPWILDLEDEV
jgi:hypothetical protein